MHAFHCSRPTHSEHICAWLVGRCFPLPTNMISAWIAAVIAAHLFNLAAFIFTSASKENKKNWQKQRKVLWKSLKNRRSYLYLRRSLNCLPQRFLSCLSMTMEYLTTFSRKMFQSWPLSPFWNIDVFGDSTYRSLLYSCCSFLTVGHTLSCFCEAYRRSSFFFIALVYCHW